MYAVFLDVNGFFCFCSAWHREDGKWIPTVSFERKGDYGKELVHSRRHWIKAEFDDEQRAVQAAIEYGQKRAERGEVGL